MNEASSKGRGRGRVFEARPRISIDGFAFPEAYAHLTSLPQRQVNKALEAILIRGLMSCQSPWDSLTTAVAPSTLDSAAEKNKQTRSDPPTDGSQDDPSKSTALARGDLSSFGNFDSAAFDYASGR